MVPPSASAASSAFSSMSRRRQVKLVKAAALSISAHANFGPGETRRSDRLLVEKTRLDYDATTATSHLRRGTSEEAEAPRHLTHHLLPHPSAFGASPRFLTQHGT